MTIDLKPEQQRVAADIATGFAQVERDELIDGDAAIEMLRKRRAERLTGRQNIPSRDS